jgi:lysozyme
MNKDKLIQELVRDEGKRLTPYRDTAGKLTIGVGRNLDDTGISDFECDLMLSNDIDKHCSELDQFFPWWKSLDEVRQRVLANMCFNLGVSRLSGFKLALSAMQSGNYVEAANQMKNSAWYTQVGNRAVRLCYMMENGKEP